MILLRRGFLFLSVGLLLTGCGGGGGGSNSGGVNPTPTPTPGTTTRVVLSRSGGFASQTTGRVEGLLSDCPSRFLGKNITIRIEGHPDITAPLEHANPVTNAQWRADVANPNNPALYGRPLPMKIFDPDGHEVPFLIPADAVYTWSP